MTGTTSVPAIQFDSAGLLIPAESDVLAGVLADYNAAFGGNLNPALNTPQGQLASSLSAVIAQKNYEFARYIQQIDPATASGQMQDAIGRLYYLTRIPSTPTMVAVSCMGLSGTVIPTGAQVADANGNVYQCSAGGTIQSGGTISLQFACVEPGPIVCAANSISIYRSIVGWDAATNSAPGIVGSLVESRADFEYRRQQSVAKNALGTLGSIYAEVFDVDGVSDVYAIDNPTASDVTHGSVTMPAHSVYIAVVGGIAADVARAMWMRKSAGSNWCGNTTVAVEDLTYSAPRPSYNVSFQIPPAQPILFAVQIASSASLPSDIVARVKGAIVSAFAGGDGGSRARIGSTIYASRFYSPVASAASGLIEIISILIGTSSATLNSIAMDIGYCPTVSESDITVSIV